MQRVAGRIVAIPATYDTTEKKYRPMPDDKSGFRDMVKTRAQCPRHMVSRFVYMLWLNEKYSFCRLFY